MFRKTWWVTNVLLPPCQSDIVSESVLGVENNNFCGHTSQNSAFLTGTGVLWTVVLPQFIQCILSVRGENCKPRWQTKNQDSFLPVNQVHLSTSLWSDMPGFSSNCLLPCDTLISLGFFLLCCSCTHTYEHCWVVLLGLNLLTITGKTGLTVLLLSVLYACTAQCLHDLTPIFQSFSAQICCMSTNIQSEIKSACVHSVQWAKPFMCLFPGEFPVLCHTAWAWVDT